MIQSNTFFPRGQNYLLNPKGVMAVEVPQNEEISGGKNGEEKRAGFTVGRRRENSRSLNFKERAGDELLRETLTSI